MSVKTIKKSEFDKLRPPSRLPFDVPIKETEWYSDENGVIVGTVFLDKSDNDWNYVILGPDENGQHRFIDVGSSLADEHTAKKQCIAKILEYAKSGETVFPQGD